MLPVSPLRKQNCCCLPLSSGSFTSLLTLPSGWGPFKRGCRCGQENLRPQIRDEGVGLVARTWEGSSSFPTVLKTTGLGRGSSGQRSRHTGCSSFEFSFRTGGPVVCMPRKSARDTVADKALPKTTATLNGQQHLLVRMRGNIWRQKGSPGVCASAQGHLWPRPLSPRAAPGPFYSSARASTDGEKSLQRGCRFPELCKEDTNAQTKQRLAQ